MKDLDAQRNNQEKNILLVDSYEKNREAQNRRAMTKIIFLSKNLIFL
jgi:hypothetical protein